MDLEKNVATFELLVKSLFAENETLKNKVAILTAEAENHKECGNLEEDPTSREGLLHAEG